MYPGVDLVYYGNQQQLDYDFVVAPGTDPGVIRMAFGGADSLTVDAAGDLVLRAAASEVRQRKPVVYQDGANGRQPVAGAYTLGDDGQVGFALASYDTSRPLVIDPVILYGTYVGGSAYDFVTGIAVDSAGNAYVTGETTSANDFPLKNAFDPTYNDPPESSGQRDTFITKINPSLAGAASLIYSTYLGGNGGDFGRAIAVDSAANAYVTGQPNSTNFPTVNAHSPTCGVCSGTVSVAFVSKLNAAGSALVYSTYLGGNSSDFGQGIAIDTSANAYVTGFTESTNFPVLNAAQPTPGGNIDAFVSKLSPAAPPATATATPTPTATATATATRTPTSTPTPIPTATRTPTVPPGSTATPTPIPAPPNCSPRPNVSVQSAPSGTTGQLTVTIFTSTNAGGGTNDLVRLDFGTATNARIDIPHGPTNQTGGFNFTLPPNHQAIHFTVRRAAAGPTHVNLTVVDECGNWPTFVGGGATAF